MKKSENRFRRSRAAIWLLCIALVLTSFAGIAAPASAADPEWPAPQNLRVVSHTDTSVTLDWDLVEGAEGYNLYHADGRYAGWAASPPHTLAHLTPNTEYAFQVAVMVQPMSNIVTVTTDAADPNAEPPEEPVVPPTPLTPPTYLKVTDMTDRSITLRWDKSPHATGYDIYVNGGWSGGVWSPDETMKTIELSPESVTGAVYTFSVAAQNSNVTPLQTSVESNKVTVKIGELAAPQGLEVVTATRTAATFGWAPVPGATSYDIYLDNVLAGSSNVNRYLATGLTEGKSYSMKVIAKSSTLTSPASDEITVTPGKNYNIVNYYTSWSIYGRAYQPTDMDVSQITHINYAFADICWQGIHGSLENGVTWACPTPDVPLQSEYVFDGEIVLGDPWADVQTGGTGNFGKLKEIKAANPHLKTMISVGGWSWSNRFSDMAASELTRHAFANSAVEFIRAYGFDGIDIDWEYPVAGGMDKNSRSPEDTANFVKLMELLRAKLDAAGQEDGNYYLLTIASGQGDDFVKNANLAEASKSLDFINIMTYDYSGAWDLAGYHNAPLYYDEKNPTSTAARNNVNGGVNGHLNGGVPNYKLVLGVPFYGKGWKSCAPGGQYQACEGATTEGTWEGGIFDYTDLEANYVNQKGFTRYWNEAAKVPYLYNSETKTYISYDDQESIMYKTAYVKSQDLAGMMVWEVSGDRNKTLLTQMNNDLPINASASSSALAIPSKPTVKITSTRSLTVTWEASADATGYDVFVDKAWKGFVTGTEFTITNVSPNTNYTIQVAAVKKAADKITAVSPWSIGLQAKTNAESSGSGSSGYVAPPASTPAGDADALQLKTESSKVGNKLTVKVNADQGADTVKKSTSKKVQITVSNKDADLEVQLPKAVLEAIQQKKEITSLSLLSDQAEFVIPVKALDLSKLATISELRITIQSPSQQVIDQLKLKDTALQTKPLIKPLDFKIEAIAADGSAVELKSFSGVYVSRIFKLDAKDHPIGSIVGVVFNPETNEYRYVPTTASKSADGSVSVELKSASNSIYTIIESTADTADVPAWSKTDVDAAVSRFITTIADDANLYITRAEFVSIVVRALGLLPTGDSSTFEDVTAATSFADDIVTASKHGIITGRSAEIFDPEGLITRQEMAVVLANAMQLAGIKNEANVSALDRFDDQSAVSAYASSSFAFMLENKIIVGVSDTRLDPKSNTTKAQAIAAAVRMLRALNFITE